MNFLRGHGGLEEQAFGATEKYGARATSRDFPHIEMMILSHVHSLVYSFSNGDDTDDENEGSSFENEDADQLE